MIGADNTAIFLFHHSTSSSGVRFGGGCEEPRGVEMKEAVGCKDDKDILGIFDGRS